MLPLLPALTLGFCGFYVSGADQSLFNNATQVVLMRDGVRTVLSMQNNYQGPPQDFAMVVPVPVILKKENVKTLPKEIFQHVDKLAAPRLVEYWEQDPCMPERPQVKYKKGAKKSEVVEKEKEEKDYGVKIEAQFTVGEYEVVILSANDALGLGRWLKDNKYKTPAGAEPLYKPYIEHGWKFFVAKVDVKKVQLSNGQAQLSPLRFHYDSESFTLPVRLGLINANDKQDLIVHVLARGQRYELANYPNVTIPTNIDLAESSRVEFPEFYASLFDRTLAKKPGAVVTEYAWTSGSCDPCPLPPLDQAELMTLGLDVMPPAVQEGAQYSFVLTRLHARYDKSSLGEDLIFKTAGPIVGGREFLRDDGGLEQGAVASGQNNFQGRYIIRHAWKGPIACASPIRGRWGGPPAGVAASQPAAATGTAFVQRKAELAETLAESPIEELGIKGKKPKAGVPLK
jgi:hypothetical protein